MGDRVSVGPAALRTPQSPCAAPDVVCVWVGGSNKGGKKIDMVFVTCIHVHKGEQLDVMISVFQVIENCSIKSRIKKSVELPIALHKNCMCTKLHDSHVMKYRKITSIIC